MTTKTHRVLHVDEDIHQFPLLKERPEVLARVGVVVDAVHGHGGELLQDVGHVVR